MEPMLTSRNLSDKEASDWRMVSCIVCEDEGEILKEAVAMESVITTKSTIAVQTSKEAVNAAYEHTLMRA